MTTEVYMIAGEDLFTGAHLEFRPTDGKVYLLVSFPSRWERFLRRIGWHIAPLWIGISEHNIKQGETFKLTVKL